MPDKKFIIFYIIIILLSLGLPAAFLDFKPSHEMAWYALYASIGITIISWPTVFFMPLAKLKVSQLYLFSFVYFATPLLLIFTGWAATIGTFGYLSNKMIGQDAIKYANIVEKRTCRFMEPHCICDTKIVVETSINMANGTLCTNKSFWKSANVGDRIKLTGLESRYGFEIYRYENITLTSHSYRRGTRAAQF